MRDPMRVLFVCTLPEPGGAASHLVSLAGALANAGHHIAVVTAPQSGVWRALEQDCRITLHAASFTTAFAPPAVATLRAAIETSRPHAIFSVFERDYWGTLRAAAQFGVPCALFVHHAGLKRVNRLLLRFVPRRFILPSDDLRHWLMTLGVPRTRTSVLGNPVDTAHFAPDPALRDETRAALGIAPDDILVGYVGRIETNKGIGPFADAVNLAMARVPALRALWVGFGRREPELDATIASSPFASRHLRRPWTDDVRPHYAAMDLLALPSTGRESFGRTLVEAQACGVPVLGSDIGGIPEAMRAPDTGRLVPPGDVAAWADALSVMALDADARPRMGAAGCAFARRTFDSAVIVREFEALVDSMRA